VSEARKDGARDAILAAAAAQLAGIGYRATTLRGVAAEVGLQAGSIYHHFPSKDAIVAEVMNRGVRVVHEAVETALREVPAGAPARDRLAAAIEAHLRASLENSAFTSAAIKSFSFVPPEIRDENRRHRRAYEDLWRDLIEDLHGSGAIPPGPSLESVRLMLLGAMNWAGEWYRRDGGDIGAIARDFAGIVVRD
jgi:AcrR family transcriptional regulator